MKKILLEESGITYSQGTKGAWYSVERGTTKGSVRMIDNVLCWAYYVQTHQHFWKRGVQVNWEPVRKGQLEWLQKG